MIHPGIALITLGGILAGLAILYWPKSGLISRWRSYSRLRTRVLKEDALKFIETALLEGRMVTVESIAGGLQIKRDQAVEMLTGLEEQELVVLEDNLIKLTAQGQAAAIKILRAHRVYERYLADKTGYDEREWHTLAEDFEHKITPAQVDALAMTLGNPSHDPHGDPIPTTSGEAVPHQGITLTELQQGVVAAITHIEDEPDTIAAQILAEGLVPGMKVQILDTTPQRIRFLAGGEECVLAPIFASAISVEPLKKGAELNEIQGEPLSILKDGQKGEVVQISPRLRGPERRRMMDLGILPGTQITADISSPSGDPTAYRIRGAMIALRKEQAELIRIKPLSEAN